MIKGVLLDFNGTLFFDTDIHVYSWNQYALKKFNKKIDNNTFMHHFHGRSNAYIIPYLSDQTITDKEEINKCVHEKCSIYQKYIRDNISRIHLVDGTIELFKFLNKHKIPYNICTASRKINVDFYYDIFPELNNYVPRTKIVFDDLVSIKEGKPAPYFYLKGSETIDVDIKDCIVVEDSYSGLVSGLTSGCKEVVGVKNGDNDDELNSLNIKTRVSNMFELIEYIKKVNNIID